MNSNKTTAKIVGALFLTSNITFILGAAALVEPILSAPDFLTLASANRAQLMLGVLLELINGIAYIGIAVLMFPILKQRFESLALGYLAFRLLEFVMQIASDLSPITLLTLNDTFLGAGAADSLHASATLLLAQRQSAFLMVSLTFGLGALLFYYMLYQTELIPRIIALWGFIGAALVLVSFAADMFGLSLSSDLQALLGLPMLLNEVFLGLWLIIRGFNASTAVSERAKTALSTA